MSMFSVFEISGSALTANSQRMNVTASNLANADSVAGPNGEAYRAKQVMFQALSQNGGQSTSTGGVRVTGVVEDTVTPMRLEYRPGHPMADEQGYVQLPNVDPVNEMVDMIAASRSYQANVEVMNTAKSLMSQTLRIGEG